MLDTLQRFLVHDVITLGQTEEDTLKEKNQKAVATFLLLLIFVLRIVAFLLKDASTAQKYLEATGGCIELLGLFVLWRTKSVKQMFYWYVPPYLINLTYFVLGNGTESGDFVGFIAIPCVAILVLGTQRSVFWLVVCFLLTAIIPFVDLWLPDIRTTLFLHHTNPEGSVFDAPGKDYIAPMEGISLSGIVIVIYLIFRTFHSELNRAK